MPDDGVRSRRDEYQLTALCIDDDPYSRRLLATILGHGERFAVLLAENGQSGLSEARRATPDVILLDLDLPDLHGTEVAAELRADDRTREIPLVGVSATSHPYPGWVKRSDLDAFVRKPIDDIRAFLGKLDGVLDAKRAGSREAGHGGMPMNAPSRSILSRRQVEILQLAANGASGPEIAARLSLSPATVKSHLEQCYRRLGAPNRPAAVARAIRSGLIE